MLGSRLRQAREDAYFWEASAAGWMRMYEQKCDELARVRAENRKLKDKLDVVARDHDRTRRIG